MDPIAGDVICVLHLMPEEPPEGKGFAYYEKLERTSHGRTEAEQALMDAKRSQDGHGPPLDPVLLFLEQLTRERERVDDQIRSLLTYARNFVRPRPYQLRVLAKASGLSPSGIRLICNNPERMRHIARNIGRSDNSGQVAVLDQDQMEVRIPDDLAEYRNSRIAD